MKAEEKVRRKYKLNVCPECAVRERDFSRKRLYQCEYCERWFCKKHIEARIAFIKGFEIKHHDKKGQTCEDRTWKILRENEAKKYPNSHPDFVYTRKMLKEISREAKEAFEQRVRAFSLTPSPTSSAQPLQRYTPDQQTKLMEAVTYRCQKCGSYRVQPTAHRKEATYYLCLDCDFKWKEPIGIFLKHRKKKQKHASVKDLGFWFPVIAAFLITFAIAMWYQYPIGVDVHFHLRIAEAWARGENGMFTPLVMRINKMPYPPLQHWLLLPVVLSPNEYFATALFQMWQLPLAVFALMYAVWRVDDNKYSALFAGLLAMGSFAYIDRTLVVSPQGLNIIFFPLAMCFASKGKLKMTTLFSTLMIYTHGIVGMAMLGGVWLWALWKRRWLYILLPLVLSIPIIFPTIPYLASGWNRMSGGMENDQERGIWASPITFTLGYLRLPVLAFPIAIYQGYQWLKNKTSKVVKRKDETFNLELLNLQRIAMLTLLAMTIMIYPWADRYVQLSVIPLSIILGTQFSRSKRRDFWFYIVFLAFLVMYSALWIWLMADAYTVLPKEWI